MSKNQMGNIRNKILCAGICCALSAAPLCAQQTMDKMWGQTASVENGQRQTHRGHLFEWEVLQNQQSISRLFAQRPLGWIRFDKPGIHRLTLTMPEGGQCEVASLGITPVEM